MSLSLNADMSTLEPGHCSSQEAGPSSWHSSCGCSGDEGAPSAHHAATGDAGVQTSAASSVGCDASARSAAAASSCSVQAAPGTVAHAAAAALQVLVSHLDKAHGLRVQGMVAEVSSS
jgi:hypothetical protein